jgi:hypothetical protein
MKAEPLCGFFVTKVMDRMWNTCICYVACSQNPLPVSIRQWEFQKCWVNTPVGSTFRRKSSPLTAVPGAPIERLAMVGHLTCTRDRSCTCEKLTKRYVLLSVTYVIRVSCKAVTAQSVGSKSTYVLSSETRQSFVSSICANMFRSY